MNTQWSPPETVAVDALRFGSALSIGTQPALAELLKDLAARGEPVTLVVGAGLSADAGLATWQTLISRLLDDLGPSEEGVDLASMARADGDDLLRKAESVIAMRLRQDSVESPEDLVRRALYENVRDYEPGPLLRAFSGLVDSLQPNVSVLTTNFDELIEIALKRRAISTTTHQFRDADSWPVKEAKAKASGSVPVMHLHGRVRRRSKGKGDSIILTESHFLKYGPTVRAMVSHALSTSTTVFWGVSLTDPNLIGPLWDTRKSRRPTYVINVFEKVSRFSVDEYRTYALAKSEYLRQKLRISPIFLKTYSQVEQLLNEIPLYQRDPDRYLRDEDHADSTNYIARLSRITRYCYDQLGANVGSPPPYELGETLRARLAGYLESTGPLGEYIEHARTRPALLQRLNELSPATRGAMDEVFGLELWLRKPASASVNPGQYRIRLVGSSSFVVREDLAAYGFEYIVSNDAEHMGCRAIAGGKVAIWDALPSLRFGGVWRSVVAVPLRLNQAVAFGADERRVPITVGAVCLTTSRHICSDVPAESTDEPVSFLSRGVLSAQGRAELFARMHAIGQDLFNSRER